MKTSPSEDFTEASSHPSIFAVLELHVGQTVDLLELAQRLHNIGFVRQRAVSAAGEFAVRGGIVDIFPTTFECPVRVEFDDDVVAAIRSVGLETGQPFADHQTMLIVPIHETSVRPGSSSALATILEDERLGELPIEPFLDLRVGDLAVHSDHGIALYRGTEHLKTPDGEGDHLVLEFAERARLYVPMQRAHLVQRYVGVEGKAPLLSRLGGMRWQQAKQRVQAGVRLMALELVQMQAARMALQGTAFGPDTEWQAQFEAQFPYRETRDQTEATAAVKRDMEAAKPMDRLLCGDVGYGKTEVALRAAFKAVMDGRQVVMLAPTTILVEQHYHTFSRRMREFPVTIKMLSRFQTKGEQAEVVKGVKDGSVDIVIGTHRLLSADVQCKNLGLVILDEEQRFGVQQKERLKRLRLLADVLTLTATPIPRTLYMALMGARDLSMIVTPPDRRLPVQTLVAEDKDQVLREAIARELARQGQVFVVHYRVQGIEAIARRVTRLVPEARVAVAHGQMPAKLLEQVMLSFMQGRIDVLVATTIIESGIDIPNANTLLVFRADTFGLADLYQLRGRVGRFDRQAYAYFLVPQGTVLSDDARKRLGALEKYTELGAGFRIAMEDLQIRGAGNLLGKEQHGHIMAVGFDMYCRLLRDAVSRLRITGGRRAAAGQPASAGRADQPATGVRRRKR